MFMQCNMSTITISSTTISIIHTISITPSLDTRVTIITISILGWGANGLSGRQSLWLAWWSPDLPKALWGPPTASPLVSSHARQTQNADPKQPAGFSVIFRGFPGFSVVIRGFP